MLSMCLCDINSLVSCTLLNLFKKSATDWFVPRTVCCSSKYIPTVIIIHNYVTNTQLSSMDDKPIQQKKREGKWVTLPNLCLVLCYITV
jgi:hypothetical protein